MSTLEAKEQSAPVNGAALLLRHARGLLVKGWTQLVTARTANGIQVEPGDKNAVAFCAVGAIERARFDNRELTHREDADQAHHLLRTVAGMPAWVINDAAADVAPVLHLYDSAIALAEQRP